MIACPRCSTPNDPGQEVCWGCGLRLKSLPQKSELTGTMVQGSPPNWPDPVGERRPEAGLPDPPPPAAPGGKRTMLGIAPDTPLSAPPPPAAPPGTSSQPPARRGDPSWSPYSSKQTMIGVAPASYPPSQPPPPAPAGKQTMLGIGSDAPPPAPAGKQTMLGIGSDAPPPAPAGKQTMLGMAPDVPPAAPATNQPSAPAVTSKGTLLGVAPGSQPPQAAPAAQPSHAQRPFQSTQPMRAPELQPPPQAQPPSTPPPQAPSQAPYSSSHPPPMASEKATRLGVAVPGIAPLHPGVAKPPSNPPSTAPSQAPRPASAEPTTEDLAVLPGHGKKRGTRWLWVLLVLAALLLAGVAAFAIFMLRTAPPLDARVGVDAQGREQLELACPRCDDGSVARLGSARAKFSGGKAVLALAQPLKIGNNELAIDLETRAGRSYRAELHVPVEYRVRGDFGSLGETPPRLAVRVEAVPGTAVIVDGKAVALGPDGTGKHLVDVSKELTGPAARVETLERKLVYSITPPGSPPQVGDVVLRLGIAALIVDAPGSRVVTESANFMLAGRTLKGGSIHVEGRPITVDPQGRFAQLMNVSAAGRTTIMVRASAPNHAPRLFPIDVERVASLKATAKSFGEKAADSYSAIASDIPAKRGWAVALPGRVSDVRSEGHTSVILLEVSKGCSKKPCLARLLQRARATVSQGDRVTAYGHVSGAVDGPRSGEKIPEILLEFMLPDEP